MPRGLLQFLLLLLACGAARAVSVSPRGTGEVLLFPWYTVDGGQQTLLTIGNPGNSARALRVRFAEGRNGRTVAALSVYLAANDTWTAAVFAPAATGAARLVSFDSSCVLDPPATRRPPGTASTFSSDAYTGANRDWDFAMTPPERAAALGASERTRQGYIEVIEMGRLRAGNGPLELADELAGATGCTAVETAWRADTTQGWRSDATQSIDLPAGGLFGNAAIVDVADGAMLTYAATALTGFYSVATAPGALHAAPDSPRPSLDDARDTADTARVRVTRVGAASVVETFPAARAIDAVTLALMQSTAFGEFNVDPAIAADSEWLLALPTRRFYSDVATDASVRAPFNDAFRDDGRAGEEVWVEFRNRNGQAPKLNCGLLDPPCVPPLLPRLDNAVNVFAWGTAIVAPAATPVFGAPVGDIATYLRTVDIEGRTFANGWSSFTFDDPTTIPKDNLLLGPTSGTFYRGLPAIGFAATRLVNANVEPGVLANFGDAVPLQGRLVGDAVIIDQEAAR